MPQTGKLWSTFAINTGWVDELKKYSPIQVENSAIITQNILNHFNQNQLQLAQEKHQKMPFSPWLTSSCQKCKQGVGGWNLINMIEKPCKLLFLSRGRVSTPVSRRDCLEQLWIYFIHHWLTNPTPGNMHHFYDRWCSRHVLTGDGTTNCRKWGFKALSCKELSFCLAIFQLLSLIKKS